MTVRDYMKTKLETSLENEEQKYFHLYHETQKELLEKNCKIDDLEQVNTIYSWFILALSAVTIALVVLR